MANTPDTPKPQISAGLCAELGEAITAALNATRAAEAALAERIYGHGSRAESQRAKAAAAAAQLALWRLLYSNCDSTALPHLTAGTDQDEDTTDTDDLSDQL